MFLLLGGTVLLIASLMLEAQSNGKDTREYKQLKNIGGTGAVIAWVGVLILSALL